MLFALVIFVSHGYSFASRLSIEYVKPNSAKYQEVYKVLKSNHRTIYGESISYLQNLYDWKADIEIKVVECGAVDSRYIPAHKQIIICYESLYQKINDYPKTARSKKDFVHRVFQNAMFTFWHEIGHALMDEFQIEGIQDRRTNELYADEFAVLSMLWRNDSRWKDVVMISALHFKSKSTRLPMEQYEIHPSDNLRYEKMITLLYGFAQKSYLRLKPEVDSLDWLVISAQEYYLERSAFWEKNLRNHTQKDFFNN